MRKFLFRKGLVMAGVIMAALPAFAQPAPEAGWTRINNGAMWADDNGKPVQAHGAGFLFVDGRWYMIGEDRSNSWNPDVNMYSSDDLAHWKFERKIIENGKTHPDLGTARMIERPKLLYCEKTGKFVVWCHWESSNYGASEAGVFYSDTVNGEYTFHWGGRPLDIKSRDCNVFVDDDGTAYFISTIQENTHLGLFRLTDDYLGVEEYTQLFTNQRREAPAIVRVDDTYYMLSSACSGWDPNTCCLAYSKSLTSGWSGLKSLGNVVAYDTQAASILTIKGTKATTYLYVGDRWQDPDLPESKTIIFPITFGDNKCGFDYTQEFDINFTTGEWRPVDYTGLRADKSSWSLLYCSSEETKSEKGAAENIFDGDIGTKWHTQYNGGKPEAPHYVAVDMGGEQTVYGFSTVPRNDNSTNGLIRKYIFSVSSDGENWQDVSGGEWLPYWSDVYIHPVKARYFKLTEIEGTYASLSEIDILIAGNDYEPENILPYVKIGNKSWSTAEKAVVDEDKSVTFGPNISDNRGSWAWSLPDGSYASGRELSLGKVKMADAGEYTVHFLDMYNRSHSLTYTLEVNSGAGVEEIGSEAAVISTRFYNLQGQPVDPALLNSGAHGGSILIRLDRLSDGTLRSSKIRG